MDLAVFGANGPTGRLVVRQALTAGHHVVAVTRKPDRYPVTSPHLDVVAADVTDPDDVERVLSTGPQAVISTFGVPYGRSEITVYSQGIAHITRAMTIHGVERLVCVTSTTVATDDAPGESLFGRKVLLPFLRNVVGRTLYDDMERMEAIVRSSGLDWTVVRPGGLFDGVVPTADYEVAPRRLSGRVTSRADLAETLVREAVTPLHPRSVIEVMTRSGLPSFTTFVKEAFGIGGGAS
ncbi:MAG: NAD(P)H-binding protein [Pseudonocardia sp.]|nr:NAD(P)H-binding protein [Pseudonocardia sp.]